MKEGWFTSKLMPWHHSIIRGSLRGVLLLLTVRAIIGGFLRSKTFLII